MRDRTDESERLRTGKKEGRPSALQTTSSVVVEACEVHGVSRVAHRSQGPATYTGCVVAIGCAWAADVVAAGSVAMGSVVAFALLDLLLNAVSGKRTLLRALSPSEAREERDFAEARSSRKAGRGGVMVESIVPKIELSDL